MTKLDVFWDTAYISVLIHSLMHSNRCRNRLQWPVR